MKQILEQIDSSLSRSIDDLCEFLRFPTVAAKGEKLTEAAEWIAKRLEDIKMDVSVHTTAGQPVVTGYLDSGAERTLMFYDHYDVQPAEPFELWDSPPFEPETRDGRIYARGVSDNKGDTLSRIWAIKAFQDTGADIPVNIKFIIEGEEEIGSPHLPEFVKENTEFLQADGGIWEFGGAGIDGRQEAWLGLKGLLYVQLEVEKLRMDAHSAYACMLPSAPYRLVWALASLKSADGRILIDGFYDDVRSLSEDELAIVSQVDLREDLTRDHYGITQFLNGMANDELKEAFYNAPTCNIAGIGAGWQGDGSKTVLPAKAMAKLDFRLVEDMDPEDIRQKLRDHLDRHGFDDINIAWHDGYPPAKVPATHPFVRLVNKANRIVYGHDLTIHITSPGSGPLYLFKDHVPMVSIGISDYDSRAHSPNESVAIEDYRLGMHRIAVLIDEMGKW